MSKVLDVPYGQLGDLSRKFPTSVSVNRLVPAPTAGVPPANTTTYDQARKMVPVDRTTGPRSHEYHQLPPLQEQRRQVHHVRDSSFAKWESSALPPNCTLERALHLVVELNTNPPAHDRRNKLLKIKVRFSDGSEINFSRDDPLRASTLKFANVYSPNAVFDKSVGHVPTRLSGVSSLSGAKSTRPTTLPSLSGASMPDAITRRELFKRLDFNGNGMLSLAELDKAIVELWPQFNNKPAIMRAYKAADLNGTGFIGRSEFEYFLRFIVNYDKVWKTFTKVDKSNDRRVSLQEFVQAADHLERGKTKDELQAIFRRIDKNGGGYLLFDEFCEYISRKKTDLALRPSGKDVQEARERTQRNIAAQRKKQQTGFVSAFQKIDVPKQEERSALFRRLDFNGNGILSLAELDKAVVELWPQFNKKPAIIRAYKSADVNGTGFIGKKEFEYFLRFIVHYNNMWVAFRTTDTSGDRRVGFQEFLAASGKLGIVNEAAARKVFAEMDKNGGGYVLFEEFCAWMAENRAGKDMPKFPKRTTVAKVRTPTPQGPTAPKTLAPIQLPEGKTMKDLFRRLDFNGNGMLSLAELDKAIVELWPQFNNKPAIMRAYKAADQNGTGWVGRKEFELFLRSIVHYNNLFLKFGAIDSSDDRRISPAEFLQGAAVLGMQHFDDSDLMSLFESMDKNQGGYVLFNEFCSALSALKAREEME